MLTIALSSAPPPGRLWRGHPTTEALRMLRFSLGHTAPSIVIALLTDAFGQAGWISVFVDMTGRASAIFRGTCGEFLPREISRSRAEAIIHGFADLKSQPPDDSEPLDLDGFYLDVLWRQGGEEIVIHSHNPELSGALASLYHLLESSPEGWEEYCRREE